MNNQVDDPTEKEALPTEAIPELEQLDFWSMAELNSIPALPRNAVISLPRFNIRQQIYHLDQPSLSSLEIRRTEGVSLSVSLRDYLVLDLEDSWRHSFQLAVHPSWVWRSSRHLITPELARWSVDRAPEIAGFIEFSLAEILDFFDWMPRGISPCDFHSAELSTEGAIYFNDQKSTLLLVFGCRHVLDRAEQVIRTFSTGYRRNCLWLGQSISYDLRLSLMLGKTGWSRKEIHSLSPGDLLHLQQHRKAEGVIDLRARVISSSASAVQWTREVNFTMTEDDARVHIGKSTWEMLDGNPDFNVENELQYVSDWYSPQAIDSSAQEASSSLRSQRIVEGVSGPEDVVLEVIAGVTQVDFNELCNIQEGSLIELQSHTLPMVRLAVRGVPILEGELVRFKDTLMVQVTRRIGHGFGDN